MSTVAPNNQSIRDTISVAIDNAHDELRRLNLQIWGNPEVMFEEVKACTLLSNWFEERGWIVQRGVYGISTVFEARYSVVPGGRTVCYNAEYDALPEIGHACGHNLIATSTLASAVGISVAMSAFQLPGTIIVMGTPAEETGGGKWIMANNGAWKDRDVCLMTHAMPDYSTPLALMRVRILEVQSTVPWQIYTRRWLTKDLHALKGRVVPIFEAAAAATGCRYREYMVNNLGIDMLSLKDSTVEHQIEVSSDFGNCTYIAPGIQTLFSINAADKLHKTSFKDAAGTMFAHDEALRAGKANAWLGLDILTDDAFFADAQEEFTISMKEAGRS